MLLDANAGDSYDGGDVTLSGPRLPAVPLGDGNDWYAGEFSIRRVSDGAVLSGNSQYVYASGEYTLSGSGGRDVDVFEAKLDAPEFLQWTDVESLQSVDRNAPPQLRWSGGGAKDRVIVEGASAVLVGTENTDVEYGSFICAVPAGVNSFTPPAVVLKLLPVGTTGTAPGMIMVAGFAHGSRARFHAALKKRCTDLGFGSELGPATFGYLFMTTKLVSFW